MKKKLLFIITKSNWGGAQKYVFELIEHLYNNPEYEVHLCVGGDGEMVQRLQEIGFKNINNLKYMSNSINPFKLILSTAELSKYIYKISPDIIHINSSFALITSVKSIYLIKIINLLRLNNYTPKIIFTAHGWPFNENRNILSKIILKFVMNISMLFVDKIITVSENVRNGIWNISKKKCKTIYNGVVKSNMDSPNIIDPSLFNHINILSIGELHPVKGHDLAILAIKELLLESRTNPTDIPIHYHIFGEGKWRAYLENRINELGLNKNVTLYGNVKNASTYINYFDIFFVPSRSEALAYVLLEAYIEGIEIISSNQGGLPEIVNMASHGELVNIHNPFEVREKLKNKINYIYNSKLSDNYTRPKSEMLFQKENTLKETLDLYKK